MGKPSYPEQAGIGDFHGIPCMVEKGFAGFLSVVSCFAIVWERKKTVKWERKKEEVLFQAGAFCEKREGFQPVVKKQGYVKKKKRTQKPYESTVRLDLPVNRVLGLISLSTPMRLGS